MKGEAEAALFQVLLEHEGLLLSLPYIFGIVRWIALHLLLLLLVHGSIHLELGRLCLAVRGCLVLVLVLVSIVVVRYGLCKTVILILVHVLVLVLILVQLKCFLIHGAIILVV